MLRVGSGVVVFAFPSHTNASVHSWRDVVGKLRPGQLNSSACAIRQSDMTTMRVARNLGRPIVGVEQHTCGAQPWLARPRVLLGMVVEVGSVKKWVS